MSSIVSRWRGRLRTRRALLAAAIKRHADAATIARRKAQVAVAERVLKRRRPKRVSAWALRDVAPGLTRDQAKRLGAALGPAFHRYGITTPERAAAAVAQFAHESANFSTTTEFASGAEYEGRADLGNTHPGDGRRFKGRGYIQITGRSNYAAVSKAFGVNFIANPGILAEPRYAAMASCWWWETHGCNVFADRCDFVGLTRRINGGTNGLADREAYWHRALHVAHLLVPR